MAGRVITINTDGEVETYFCEPVGHVQIHGDYVESWQPQAMSLLVLQRVHNIAKKITGELASLGIFGMELFVKQDEVWVQGLADLIIQ